jgi:SH3-like domain-containing protein
MAALAALGFRLHTGWAALVAIAGEPGRLEVVIRRRIELLPAGDSVPRFVYHRASELPMPQAAELLQRAEAASKEAALVALKDALSHIRSVDLEAKVAGVPSSSRPVPKELFAVLRSHPMIHSAEGALFLQAVVFACRSCGLAVSEVREREVWLKAADSWGLKEAGLRKQVDGLRKSVGVPWGTDQKTAAAFALFALRPVA